LLRSDLLHIKRMSCIVEVIEMGRIEDSMTEFVQAFKLFDAVCSKYGLKTTGENIELFKIYTTEHVGDRDV